MITVEVRDLRIFGYHGVRAAEAENGQDFVYDVALDVGDRGLSDRLEDAVDYGDVALAVKQVFPAQVRPSFILLGVFVATATGLLAGWIPPNQASKLPPVEALRYE